jgi:hypothetical protein
MPRRRSTVSQTDVTRAIKGMMAAGVTVDKISGVKLTADGFVILLGDRKAEEPKRPNEWDEVLK